MYDISDEYIQDLLKKLHEKQWVTNQKFLFEGNSINQKVNLWIINLKKTLCQNLLILIRHRNFKVVNNIK